jgi:hypothetical protein
LAVAAALQQENVGADREWRFATGTKMKAPRTPAEGWMLLTYFTDYWLNAAEVRPWLQFQDGKVQVTLGSDWGHSPCSGRSRSSSS